MVMRFLGPFGGIICSSCIIEVAFDMLECDVLEERGFEERGGDPMTPVGKSQNLL